MMAVKMSDKTDSKHSLSLEVLEHLYYSFVVNLLPSLSLVIVLLASETVLGIET